MPKLTPAVKGELANDCFHHPCSSVLDADLMIITMIMSRLAEEEKEALIPVPAIIPDTSIKCCELCDSRFTVLSRRFHCQNCPKIVCANCSGNRVALKDHKPSRVCDSCYETMLSEGKIRAESPRSPGDQARPPSLGDTVDSISGE